MTKEISMHRFSFVITTLLFLSSQPIVGIDFAFRESSDCSSEIGEGSLFEEEGDSCFCEREYMKHGDLERAKRYAETRIVFLGDSSVNDNARRVLRRASQYDPDLILHVGDLDYLDSPTSMERHIDRYFDSDFPYLFVIGNHENLEWYRYQKNNVERIQENKEIFCEGNHGVFSICYFRGIQMVLSGIGTLCDDSRHFSLLENVTPEPWNICAFHKVHSSFSIGKKRDEVPLRMYELCNDIGGFIVTGHDHTYARSKTIENVYSKRYTNEQVLEPGKSVILSVGVGGKGKTRSGNTFNENYWNAKFTSDSNPEVEYGFLVCDFLLNHVTCQYVTEDGNVLDRFEYTKEKTSETSGCIPICPECTKSWESPVPDGCGGICPMDNCKSNERCSSSRGYTCYRDESCQRRCDSFICVKPNENQPTNYCGGTCDLPQCNICP